MLKKYRLQVVLVYLQRFRRSSLLKCVLQPKITKKTKTTFKVIDVGTPERSSALLVMLSRSVSATVLTLELVAVK